MLFVLESSISRHIHEFLIFALFIILVSEKWTMNTSGTEFMAYFAKNSIYTSLYIYGTPLKRVLHRAKWRHVAKFGGVLIGFL